MVYGRLDYDSVSGFCEIIYTQTDAFLYARHEVDRSAVDFPSVASVEPTCDASPERVRCSRVTYYRFVQTIFKSVDDRTG